MNFASFINPVHLDSDPESGEDGDFYYSTTLKTYRMMVDNVWISVTNNLALDAATNYDIQFYGDEYTESVNITVDSFHKNTIFYVISASTSYINVPVDNVDLFPHGGSFRVVRGGVGPVEIIPEEGVTLNLPSNVYLTTTGDAVSITKIDDSVWLVEGNFPDLY